VKKLLEEVGVEGERIEMYNIGASDAVQFATACNEMTDKARSLGPNPLRTKKEVNVE
jgi:coenzyme F420-reducing hydrogenase delta subunit